MTQAVAQILKGLDELSPAELNEVRHAVIERTTMTEDLTEEDFGFLAAEMFHRLDEEEAAGA